MNDSRDKLDEAFAQLSAGQNNFAHKDNFKRKVIPLRKNKQNLNIEEYSANSNELNLGRPSVTRQNRGSGTYADSPQNNSKKGSNVLSAGVKIGIYIALAVIAIGLFGLGIWFLFSKLSTFNQEDVPLITINKPIKVKPANPGGQQFFNDNTEVFDLLQPDSAPNRTEQVAPQIAKPVAPQPEKSVDPIGVASNIDSETNVSNSALTPSILNTNETAENNVIVGDPTPLIRIEPEQNQQINPNENIGEVSTQDNNPITANLEAILSPQVPIEQAWQIQFAALRTLENAENLWLKLRSEQPDLLGAIASTISTVSLDNGSILYRLRAGAYANRDDANATCQSLRGEGIDCFIVAPAK